MTAVAPYVPTGELQFLPADVQRYEAREPSTVAPTVWMWCAGWSSAAAFLLRPGGWLRLTEVGGDQDQRLVAALIAAGFHPPATWSDEDGDLRGPAARRGRS